MAKANKKVRDATLGGVNWWDYLTSIRPKGHRNEPQYLDYRDVKNKTGLVKITNKLIKERKKKERKWIKCRTKERLKLDKIFRIQARIIKRKTNPKQDQIQYGIDLANWWDLQHG